MDFGNPGDDEEMHWQWVEDSDVDNDMLYDELLLEELSLDAQF